MGEVREITKEMTEEAVRAIQKGLVNWYDFEPGTSVLYIGSETDALAEALVEKELQVVCTSVEQISENGDVKGTEPGKFGSNLPSLIGAPSGERHRLEEGFDYLICVETLERQADPRQTLSIFKTLLKPTGKLLLGMNNRYGLRYFCGDRDPYTGRNFDGVEGYRKVYVKKEDIFRGRCYSRAEIKAMLQDAGFPQSRFYSVLTDLQNPVLLYGEDYLPNEDLANRVFPTYHFSRSVFLEEESLYSGLVDNGMFHAMANAYLVECPLSGECSDVVHVTSSMARGREDAMLTLIHKSGIVEKRAAYPEGEGRLEKLLEHGKDLAAHGIPVVDATLENGSYRMPYIEGETGQLYLKRLMEKDIGEFLQAMDHFRDLILRSSEIVKEDKGDGLGAVLKKGYIDMVPLNSFYQNGTFVFYDQEFCEENYPANVLIWRMVATFYFGDMGVHKRLPMNVLLERYGLMADLPKWQELEWDFLGKLRRERELSPYYNACRRNDGVVNANRQHVNYPADDYQHMFVDIFRNADTRKLILFGSGQFAKKFLSFYGKDYFPYAIIDNNPARWGQEMESFDGAEKPTGITIQSPELLRQFQSGEHKVLICIKNYLPIMRQLDEMGVSEYSIYDPAKDYPRKRHPIAGADGTV